MRSIQYAGLIEIDLICSLRAQTTALLRFGIVERSISQLVYLWDIKKESQMLPAREIAFTLPQMEKTNF